jgi:hypothetical protein
MEILMNAPNLEDRDLERLARKRAAAKMGWYIHALVYVCVNLLLTVLSAMSGGGWAVYPALGWGIGLAVHGVFTFVVTGGAGLHEHLVQRERRRLTLKSDPW